MKIRDILSEFKERPHPGENPEVLTLTERNGFVKQSDRFNKRLATEDLSKYKLIHRDDFAFNPYLLWAGAIARNNRFDEGVISPLYPTFQTNADHDPAYIQYFLLSPQMSAKYDNIAFGSVPRRRRSSVKDFLNLSIPDFPPLAEQQRIAGVLNQTTSILELARQEVREIDESRSALFESLFPASNYPVSTIGNFFSETQYGSSKKSGEAGKYPMLRMGNLSSTGSISYSDLKYLDLEEKEINKYTLRNRDILFNRTNSKELVGKTAVYYGEGDQVAYAGYLIRCRTNDLATPEFISGFLNSRIGKAQLFQRAKAIVGMANINAKELRTLRIPSVPVAEQEKYTSASRQLEDLRLAVEKKIEKLEELQKSLSTRAFAGQL